MGDLDKLIAAVEAGKYDRPSGVRRYYDFGEDSIGIVPGSRMARMKVLRDGNEQAISFLRALQAQSTPPINPEEAQFNAVRYHERFGPLDEKGNPLDPRRRG